MKALRIEPKRDRRETSIFRIEDMGDYDVIRSDIGMVTGGALDD